MHIPLETYSEAQRGMCIGDLTINIPQLILNKYMRIIMQSVDFQQRNISMTCIHNIMCAPCHKYDFLLSSGMQAPPAKVHVVLEVPSEVKEGMYAH